VISLERFSFGATVAVVVVVAVVVRTGFLTGEFFFILLAFNS
jgi:alpha/beta superfamily hydrolase